MDKKTHHGSGKSAATADLAAEFVSKVMIYLCVAIFVVMVFSVSCGVVGRYIPFIRNPRWTQELAVLSMIWLCFVGAGYAIKEGRHVRMTILEYIIPKWSAQTLHMLAYVLLLAVNVFWIIYGIELMQLTGKSRMAATGWPLSINYLSVTVGGVYGAAMSLYRLVKGGW